jgi:GNAT superfamily N-acetyltransferase
VRVEVMNHHPHPVLRSKRECLRPREIYSSPAAYGGDSPSERSGVVAFPLRAFTEEDYPRLVEISNRVYPEYRESVEEVRHRDSVWESDRYERVRLVAEDGGGRMAGYGEISHIPHQFHPRRFALELLVDPELQGRGVGSALYDHLLAELRGCGALSMRASARESMAASLSFLTHRGFVEVQREWESRLDVGAFDFTRFAGAEERAAGQGITFTTLAEERERDPEALRKAYDLQETCERDVPAVEPVTPVTFEHFISHTVESPGALLDAYFLAMDGNRYVGVSNITRSQGEPEILYQELTGVLREYRGKGIAMALKLRTVAYARDRGFREIRTWNATSNRPMLRINEAMGFQKQPAWVEFQKQLEATNEEVR